MRQCKALVIGLGEIGSPIFKILQEIHGLDEVEGFDLAYHENPPVVSAYSLQICIPWSDRFIEIVRAYQTMYRPKLTVIHSTVPVGTSDRLDAVHSPVLGRHPNMVEDIKKFTKWFGGEQADEASDLFKDLGTRCVMDAKETELLKLVCLVKYGLSISFANYVNDVFQKYGFPYESVIDWDKEYNAGVAEHLKRPLLTPSNGPIGGHCVIPGTKLLNAQHPNPMLDQVLVHE